MGQILQDPTVWVLFSFLIFVFGAYKLGMKTFLDKLDGRIGEIRSELEEAENLRIEAQELLAQYQRRQREAMSDAEEIIEKAKKQAVMLRREAEAELDEALTRKEALLAARLRRMEEAAIQDIQSYAADLAISATAHIIAERLDDKSNARLVDECIQDLPRKFAA